MADSKSGVSDLDGAIEVSTYFVFWGLKQPSAAVLSICGGGVGFPRCTDQVTVVALHPAQQLTLGLPQNSMGCTSQSFALASAEAVNVRNLAEVAHDH